MHILQMIEDGKISAAEGLRLLNAMTGKMAEAAEATPGTEATGTGEPEVIAGEPAQAESAPTGEIGQTAKSSAAHDPQIQYWRRWWMIPLYIGVGITIVGALLMYWAIQASGIGFWFLCSWLPFLFGVGIIALAWASRTSRWVHVRVDNAEGKKPNRIAISLPIPLRVVAWALRTFGNRIEALKHTAIDEMLLALEDSATPDAPIFIDVDQGEKGERVQVYIG
jgi:hypothetical protein